MPKSNFLRKKNKTGATADFKRLKAKVRLVGTHVAPFTPAQFARKRMACVAEWPPLR